MAIMKNIRMTLFALLMLSSFFYAQASTESTYDEQKYLLELYKIMNPADKVNRSEQFYLDNAVRPALQARIEMPWGKTIPEREWVHFVLPIRVNNEALDAHRPVFYDELKDRIKDLPMTDAILEINHWCHEKATYQPSDGRTHSPLQTVSSAIGRCGEESTFTVAALRAMGIPARQVYTPRWAHTDDNHAWVEAWADGKWYFLGACEPEPVLNLGWFNDPAARGMLMHARVPGKDYNGPEEVLARANGNTDINVTSNYAPIDTLTVTILDSNNAPITDARVTFRVYNYAEYYTIASKTTDTNGNASIVAGLGDLIVWATKSDGSSFGFTKASVGKDRNISLTLDLNSTSKFHTNFDIVPPVQRDASVIVDDAMRAENDRRKTVEDSIRKSYTSTFPSKESIAELSTTIGVDSELLWNYILKSRGNHNTILDFLKNTATNDRAKAMLLLGAISDKDLTDISMAVLQDHLTASGNGKFFANYVMSPRISAEELTPYRQFFNSVITEQEIYFFRNNPQEWVKWVAENIDVSLDWYPAQATMNPRAVWEKRVTSSLSRDIFFVAAARAMNIPARIDPITMKTQWADRNEAWHDADFNSQSSNITDTKQGVIKLIPSTNNIVDNPKYYSNFTISKIENGEPILLNYPDFIPLSDCFEKGEKLDYGQYLITTGQRMADGTVLSQSKIITLNSDLLIDTLEIRKDENSIQVIGSFDSESLFKPKIGSAPQSLLSATGRGYYVLGLIKPNHEPSNHTLRDLAAETEALEAWGRPIVILYEDDEKASRNDSSTMPQMPSTVVMGSDIDSKILSQLKNIPGVKNNESPIFIIADTFNRVVFVSQGYTIGIGHRIAEITKQLK